MKVLLITQAKPNPSGKDKFGPMVPFSQLAGEWVDFKNSGDEPYSLAGIELQHAAYTPSYPNGVWEKVYTFGRADLLGVGMVIRIHSGGRILQELLAPIDLLGADHHLFSGKGYVWNNDKNDFPRLVKISGVNQITEIDKVKYWAYPPEGKILKRLGTMLT